MATRMQQRRGTASQWISSNDGDGPILNAGEIGWESDTNKFKVGDGVSYWVDLDYFADVPTLGGSIDDYVPLTQKGAANGVAELDADGKLKSAQIPNIEEITQDILDTALVAGTGLDKTYNDTAGTYTMDIDSTVATLTGTQTLSGKTLTSPVINTPTGITKSDVGLGNVDNTSDTNKPVSTAAQTALDLKAPLANPTFTGTVTLPTGTVTAGMILDGTIVNADINASAAIDKTKISGTAITAGDTGTVTSTMILDGTIVNADINASAAIAQSKIDGLTTDLGAKLALSGGSMTGAIAMGTNKITGLGTPTDSTDAANKAYVDAVTEGLHIHPSVVAATTSNVTLASALENGDTLDGITLATNDRILVKNQTTTSENGIYVVQASGQPSRATDFDTASEVDSGDFVFVSSGTANGSTGWVQTNKPATIGTDPILFTQFAGAGTYTAGNGLTLTGTVFSANIGTDIQAYNSTLAAVAGGTYTGDDSITTLGTITSGTWTGTTIAIANGGTGQTTAMAAATALLPSQTSNSGKYLTNDGSGTLSWGTVTGYSAPTLGSTSIASGATVTTIVGLTNVRSDVFTTLDANGYEVDLEAMQIMGAL